MDKDGRWSIRSTGIDLLPVLLRDERRELRGPVDSSSYLPSWYANLPFDFETPKDARAPKDRTLTKVNSGDTGVAACLGTDKLPSGPDACAKASTTSSGRVVGSGPTPIAKACVYVFADNDDKGVGGAITDANGQWTVEDLPSDTTYVIDVIPPFDLGGEPCRTEGPPPKPDDGEVATRVLCQCLADLAAEDLKADPYAFAVSRGAQELKGSTTGVDVCLTADSGDVKARPDCDPRIERFRRAAGRSERSPISGGCVAWRSTLADPSSTSQTAWVDQRGTWSFDSLRPFAVRSGLLRRVDGTAATAAPSTTVTSRPGTATRPSRG